MMQNYRGIVTSVKRSPDPRDNLYTIVSTKAISAKSAMLMEVNDIVDVTLGDRAITSVEVAGKASSDDFEKALGRLVGALDIGLNANRVAMRYRDRAYGGALHKMAGALEGAALSLAGAYLSGAPIIVRFHHDGDGSSGAVSLYRALSCISEKLFVGQRGVSWVMHRGVEYDRESFYADTLEMKNYESASRPVVLISDFGTAPGSEQQLRDASGKATVIMLDHHPPYTSFPKGSVLYINPWDYGSDTNFTAGLLTSFLAETLCDVDTDDMKSASLISDFSAFADRSDGDAVRRAVILDYLTNVAGRSDSSISRLTPSYIESVLSSKEKSDDIFYTASSTMNEMLDLGVKSVKPYRCKDGITAFVLEFETLPKSDTGYPLPGRYSSRLQERLESINGERTITLMHYGGYITLRISKGISKAVGILGIIDEIAKSSDYDVSGGGHNEAASIRVDKSHTGEVVNTVLRKIGASL